MRLVAAERYSEEMATHKTRAMEDDGADLWAHERQGVNWDLRGARALAFNRMGGKSYELQFYWSCCVRGCQQIDWQILIAITCVLVTIRGRDL
jgi:hypothetical protein